MNETDLSLQYFGRSISVKLNAEFYKSTKAEDGNKSHLNFGTSIPEEAVNGRDSQIKLMSKGCLPPG